MTASESHPAIPPVALWSLDNLLERARRVAAGRSDAVLHPIEGRWVGILAAPGNGLASRLAVGFSVLPAGCEVPVHSHEAEEVAVVLDGTGTITIGDRPTRVGSGSVLVTPSGLPHRTAADEARPLVILWVYAPPGSETVWSPQAASE